MKKYQFESVGIFQYHDELLAASSKLPNKVDDEIAKNRINIINPLLSSVYGEKKSLRTQKKQYGYVMEIREKTIIVRPELAAPEVDDYDEVEKKSIRGRNIEI